jgi:hypothetical protein
LSKARKTAKSRALPCLHVLSDVRTDQFLCGEPAPNTFWHALAAHVWGGLCPECKRAVVLGEGGYDADEVYLVSTSVLHAQHDN